MSILSLVKPIIGKPDATEDVRIVNALTAIEVWANGNIGADNLLAESILEAALAKGSVGESRLSAAVIALLGAKVSGLSVEAVAAELFEGKNGKLHIASHATAICTLPKPVANTTIGVYADGVTVSVKCSEGHINGGFVKEESTIVLPPGTLVILQAEGTGYLITSGEPRREAKYSAPKAYDRAEAEAGITTSASRDVEALLSVYGEGETAMAWTFKVGGQLLVPSSAHNSLKVLYQRSTYPLRVPAGQALQLAAGSSGVEGVEASILTL
jgi:hypothetical protein